MDDVGVAYTFPAFDGGLAGDALVLHLLDMAPDIIEDPEGDGCEGEDTGDASGGDDASSGGSPTG
jgi:hypothetical protein